MLQHLYRAVALIVALAAMPAALRTQNNAAPAPAAPPAPAEPFTLRANARAVVTDVLVLDRHGNPVHNLPASAFHLYDNKEPQKLASFEEHEGPTAPVFSPESGRPNFYTNAAYLRVPTPLNVLVIDIVNLNIPDQMWLSFQLEKFIKQLAPGVAFRIYLNVGEHTVMAQDFTTDHAKLLGIVQRSLPHFPQLNLARSTDINTLHQIAVDLAPVPGRKNLVWFSGGAPLTLNAFGASVTPTANMRLIYDELESARIAVYPIDARGLIVGGGSNAEHGSVPTGLPANDGLSGQHGLMSDVAAATGGLATYNNNGLWQAAQHAVDTGDHFYSLSYSPDHFVQDDRWHNIRVEVDSGGETLHLSYRHGYFADDSHSEKPLGLRTRLLAGNKTQVVDPQQEARPIIFTAQVEPLTLAALHSPKERPLHMGQTRYAIRFLLPADAFARHQAHDESEVTVDVAMLATNRNGSLLARGAKQVTLAVDEARLRLAPDTPIPILQEIDLNRGDTFLYLAVWDATNRRIGVLTVPLQVPAAP